MKVKFLSSAALALAGTISVAEATAQESVITSYEYEVMTSELVVTRTIPKYITLKDAAGSATASKPNYSNQI
jgi:hypothetical protein